MFRSSKKLVLLALMTSIGIVLQVFESHIPIPINLPGGKIGLANIVGLILIPIVGGACALAVSVLRAFIGSMLFGGMVSAIYSLGGAVLSTAVMFIAYKYLYPKATLIGIGVLGAAAHNAAQVTVAAIMLKSIGIFSYLPILLIISLFSGGFTGVAAEYVLRGRIKWSEEQKAL